MMTDLSADQAVLEANRPPQPSPVALHAEILSRHVDSPQAKGLAQVALLELEHGLAELAKLGHRLAVVRATEAIVQQYPKMLYLNSGPDQTTVTVDNEAEEKKFLSQGWRLVQTPVVSPAPAPTTARPPTVGFDGSQVKDQKPGLQSEIDWLDDPPMPQARLDVQTVDPPAAPTPFTEGRLARAAGHDGTPPMGLAGQDRLDWQRGWDEGAADGGPG
jgi:hypothetical protein